MSPLHHPHHGQPPAGQHSPRSQDHHPANVSVGPNSPAPAVPSVPPNSLSAHFETFRASRLALKSPQTVYQYRLNLERFSEFLGRPAVLSDLTDSTVSDAIAWLLRVRRLSPSSASKFRDNICCLWRFLSRKRVDGVTCDPDVPEVREPERIPVALTREQLRRIWEYLQRMPGDVAGIPACDWFCSLVATCWDTGARKGELFGLRWADVDLDQGFILARAETVKGGLRDRLYRVRPETVELLRKVRGAVTDLDGRDLVWPWPKSETIFYRELGMIMRANGLPDDRRYKMHVLRKSVASHLMAADGDPTRALGHSSSSVTRVYLDPRIAREPSPVDRLFRIGE